MGLRVNAAPKLSICLLLISLFTGCVKYRPLELDPIKTAAEVRSRALPATLDPDSLAEAAVANSGDVAIVRARLAEAEAAIITAKPRINPALSGEGGYNRTPESVSSYSASVGYTIETGGKRAYRTLAAQKNAEAARIAVAEGFQEFNQIAFLGICQLELSKNMRFVWMAHPAAS